MTTLEAQEAVRELISTLYDRANVVISGRNSVMPPVPYIVLTFGSVLLSPGQSAFLDFEDGVEQKGFTLEESCTVELVTMGTAADEFTTPDDTSVSDLQQLALFLSSEYASYFMQERNMAISTGGSVIPIYNLKNGVSVPYRASLQLSVTFIQTLEDIAMLRTRGEQYTQTDSSASATLASQEAGYMTEVNIEKE